MTLEKAKLEVSSVFVKTGSSVAGKINEKSGNEAIVLDGPEENLPDIVCCHFDC